MQPQPKRAPDADAGTPASVSGARTLIELLAARARETPARVAYHFCEEPRTFGELWAALTGFAGHLRRLGVGARDRVVLVLPNGHDFFAAFYGVLRAGAIAVPLFPGSGPERVLAIAALCGARAVVVPSEVPAAALARLRGRAAGAGLALATVAESGPAADAAEAFPEPGPDDVAFLQYTSGSTGDPKGVMLTHGGLLTNVRQMIEGWAVTGRDRFVSWLPAYHDMGLIAKTIVPFHAGAALFLYPTSLGDVRTWIDAIHRHRGTFTAAPDFAYRLCLRRIADPGAFDLSSLRIALNAAEPVRAATIAEFERTFGLRDVLIAGYGLAEATVAVSTWPPGTPIRVDARGFVSIGRPFPGIEVAILARGDRERLAPPGEIGEILVRTPAPSLGYWGNAEATARLFRPDGFLHTGDLGYLDPDGHLFIVGRSKNVILTGGRTLGPREVEEAVESDPLVRFSAALGIDRGGLEGEQLYVFAEIRSGLPGGAAPTAEEMAEAARRIVAGVHDRIGLRPARVVLVRPKAIPLTHNGKVRHVRLREKYLDGTLRGEGAILYPPA